MIQTTLLPRRDDVNTCITLDQVKLGSKKNDDEDDDNDEKLMERFQRRTHIKI